MTETNPTTVASYNEHIQEYIDGTPKNVEGFVQTWIDDTLSGLPTNARILEIGSAFGRDADYIEGKGYAVERTDATPGFVELLQNNGHEARLLNAITEELGNGYDLIFADAVLLHFTRDEARSVIRKVSGALNAKGRFAFTLKYGEGEGWSDEKLGAPRYFCYWDSETIKPIIEQSGFTNIRITDDFTATVGSKAKWIQVIADK